MKFSKSVNIMDIAHKLLQVFIPHWEKHICTTLRSRQHLIEYVVVSNSAVWLLFLRLTYLKYIPQVMLNTSLTFNQILIII